MEDRYSCFAFSKHEYLSSTVQILADTPKVVRASLQPEKPAQQVVRAKSEGSQKKAKQASSEKEEAPIPVEF